MLGENECYELYIGYANILYNRARYEEAIKMYNKVIKLKPNLINAQSSLALIY
jgi:tetratricopeptide (TPR) repeat protein